MRKLDYASLFTLRKDGRYMYRWTDEHGKRRSMYDRDPEALYRKVEGLKAKAPPTFGEIAEAWRGWQWERVAYKTREAYTAPLRRVKEKWGDRQPDSITAQEIGAYLSTLAKQQYSRRSVQMHRDILNMIYRYGMVNEGLRFNPVEAVSLPRNLTSTKRELPEDAAVEAVKTASVPFSLFAKLCLYSGLRKGEALALRYEDVDREHRCIHVTKAVEFIGNVPNIKPPKTKAGVRDAILLDALAAEIPHGTGYIFCREDGGLLTKMQFRDRWEDYCKAIGYAEEIQETHKGRNGHTYTSRRYKALLTPHQLRHGFATILYEAGIPDKDAQELLGHASIGITRDIYTHIRQSRREQTAERLNAFVSNSVSNSL